MDNLDNKHCIPCEGGVPPLTAEQIQAFLQTLTDWQLNTTGTVISREYTFSNFYKTMAFVNALAFIAHRENHHPDLKVGYNYCKVSYTTHAIQGLSQNDFICAEKIAALWNATAV